MTTTDQRMIDDFAAYQRGRNLAATTIRNRDSIVGRVATQVAPLTLVTTRELRIHIGRDGISAGTRSTERNALVAFFRFAVGEQYRPDDPTTRLEPVRAPKGTPRPFTLQQVERMLASGAYARTRAMILLGYFQGFRVSSIARVHGHDIDLDGHTISTVGKGGKQRTLPLHPVIAEVAQHMPRDDYWFPARRTNTGHIRPASVTDLITKAKIRAGIHDPHLTPHSLRHGFGTDLVEAGVDIRVIKELMMHESLATTQIYTAVSARRKRDAIFALPRTQPPARSGRTRRYQAPNDTTWPVAG